MATSAWGTPDDDAEPDDGQPIDMGDLAPGIPTLGPWALIVTPIVDEDALDRICAHISDRIAQAVADGFSRAGDTTLRPSRRM